MPNGINYNVELVNAVLDNQLDKVKACLQNGAAINARNVLGGTALYHAVKQGHINIVQYLLIAGADPNIANNMSFTPLMTSFLALHDESTAYRLVELLLRKNADVNAKTRWSGSFALLQAVRQEFVTAVALLLRADADPNLQDDYGNTVLIVAATYSENPQLVQYLLQFGANPTIKNNDGVTALAVATSRNQHEMVQLITTEIEKIKTIEIEKNKTISEVRRNARLLWQGYNQKDSVFSSVPKKILYDIIADTVEGNNPHFKREQIKAMASRFFAPPPLRTDQKEYPAEAEYIRSLKHPS